MIFSVRPHGGMSDSILPFLHAVIFFMMVILYIALSPIIYQVSPSLPCPCPLKCYLPKYCVLITDYRVLSKGKFNYFAICADSSCCNLIWALRISIFTCSVNLCFDSPAVTQNSICYYFLSKRISSCWLLRIAPLPYIFERLLRVLTVWLRYQQTNKSDHLLH